MLKRKIILLHTLFWVILFLKSQVLVLTSDGLSFRIHSLQLFFSGKKFVLSAGYFSIGIVAFYAAYMVVKRILIEKKILPAVLYIILAISAVVTYRAFLEFGIFKPFFQYDNYPHAASIPWKYFIPNASFYYWDYMATGMAFAFFMHWQRIEKMKRERENLDKTAQLKFLQSQINPHFLFNTINDIYALSLQKSDKTPEALLQLSGLLRYALYDNKELVVPLEKELAYIRDYLDLQRTSYENKFFFELKMKGDIIGWNIPPMLLLPFVENACKHGITNNPECPVRVNLEAGTEKLVFVIVNQIRVAQKEAEGGIGIENIRKRLELLYPLKHICRIKATNHNFIVELEINK